MAKKPLYKVLMCGARDWDDMQKIENVITSFKAYVQQRSPTAELVIICGGAPGADTMARLAATKLDVHTAEVNALWGTRHRSAGPQRNSIMLSLNPEVCVAFHHDISKSKGTKDMTRQCEKLTCRSCPAAVGQGREVSYQEVPW
jgi:hypothetical protein